VDVYRVSSNEIFDRKKETESKKADKADVGSRSLLQK
jgi:hypothetical protein